MIFNAYDIFIMAESLERNGAEFYSSLASSRSKEPALAELFQRLAKDESEHEGHFCSLRNAYKLCPDNGVQELDGLYVQYLESLVKGTVFNGRNAAKLMNSSSREQVLEEALALERSMVVFYASIKDAVPSSLDRSRVDSIIREEIRHIAALSALLGEIKGERQSPESKG